MNDILYKFLGFFDKDGNDLNFVFDEVTGIWEGKIHIPEVSVGLFESANIFLVEEFKTTGGITKFGVPHYSNPNATDTSGGKWIAHWIDDKLKDIFLYQFDLSTGIPQIEILDSIEIDVDVDPNQTGDIVTGQIISDEITNTSLQLNIALNSEDEDIFERTLLIEEKDTGHIIARIDFYGETIGEDERLPQNLYKLGLGVDKEEFDIFRDSDINEFLPDFELINRKRIELLIEGRNIKPYIGAYKALVNAIKFYGYDNIKIKEYWLNIDKDSTNYGKYKSTPVRDVFDTNVDMNDDTVELPNKTLKKTSLFSLVYRLNKLNGEVDEYDLPITLETSEFTIEEVLIKLYGLKKILMKKWLSGNSRIIDITGEADYFSKIEQNVWINENRIDKFDSGIHPCFTISPSCKGYIKDLRTLEDIQFPAYTPYLLDPNLLADSDIIASDIADVLLAYFTNYSPNLDTVAELPDKPGIPVGYPIVLENCSFTIIWNDAKVSWNELSSTGSLILDFPPKNVGTNDIFTIRDRASNEQVSYIAQSGDDIEDVVNNLYAQILTEINIGDGRPWSYYQVSQEDTNNSGTPDTIRFKQIFSGNIGVDLIGETINGGLQQSPGPNIDRQLVTGNTLNTWDTYGIGNFYEMEWRIFKSANETPAYDMLVRGGIGEYNKLALALPYTGTYSIEMKLFDTFNQVSQKILTDCVVVESKNVEFIGFYKAQEKSYTWNNVETTFKEYGSYWQLPIVPEAITWEGHASLYESLDRANYILNNSNPDHQLSYHFENPDAPIQNILYTPGAFFWDNLEPAIWNDIYHIWWDGTKISGDTPANFRIYNVDINETITIEQFYPFETFGQHTFTTNDLSIAANELNNSQDAVISKYIYNPVYRLTTGGDTEIVFIQAVAKWFGENGDWTNLTWSSDIVIRYPDLHDTNNPTWNEIRFIEDGKVLPKLTHITFTYDKSKIPGKTSPKWRIMNLDNIETEDIYFTSRWLTYLFKRAGRYTISLDLEDSNGNPATLSKNMVIIK